MFMKFSGVKSTALCFGMQRKKKSIPKKQNYNVQIHYRPTQRVYATKKILELVILFGIK